MDRWSAVIGAGTMGLGIAYVLAAAGDDLLVVESDAGRAAAAVPTLTDVAESAVARGKLEEAAAKALLGRISVVAEVGDLPTTGADLVVEAVPERVELKKSILREIEERCAPAILASNTSGLSIDELGFHRADASGTLSGPALLFPTRSG